MQETLIFFFLMMFFARVWSNKVLPEAAIKRKQPSRGVLFLGLLPISIWWKEKKGKERFASFLSLYRSSSQNKDDFETFLENLELNFDHMAGKKPFHDDCSWWS